MPIQKKIMFYCQIIKEAKAKIEWLQLAVGAAELKVYTNMNKKVKGDPEVDVLVSAMSLAFTQTTSP